MEPDLSSNDLERVVAGTAALRESLRADAVPEHPPHDDIVAYVDATASDVDREIIEAHLEICQTCAEDVEDLRGLRSPVSTVAPIRRRGWTWFAAAPLAAAAVLAAVFVWTHRVPQPPLPIAAGANRGSKNVGPKTPEGQPAIGLRGLAADDREVISAALRTGRMDLPPYIPALRGQAGTLLGARSAPRSFGPVRPVGTAVEGARPVFEWTSLPGATSYVVFVFDTDLDKIAESGSLPALQWMPAHPLQRDRIYIWQVRARTASGDVTSPAPPAPEARFRVLAQAEADRVAAVRGNYAGSPLALGILLGHAGLLDEAERHLKEAVRANPSSQEAQRLLASLRTRPQSP